MSSSIKIKTRNCKGCKVDYPFEFFPLAGKITNLDANGQPYRRHRCGENGNSCYNGHKYYHTPNGTRAKGEKLQELKETLSCSISGCGYSKKTHDRFTTAALDFHHHRKNKKHNVGNMIRDGYSWANILKEIKKCVVICCRCHAELHGSNRHKEAN